jgi:hypothetical protein
VSQSNLNGQSHQRIHGRNQARIVVE